MLGTQIQQKTNRFRTLLIATAALGVVLIGIWFLFAYMFLSPLKPTTLKIPPLNHVYKDPAGLFLLKGPSGWDYVSLPSEVKIRPRGFDQYMGVVEVNVIVRRMDEVPVSSDLFLAKMAKSISLEERPNKDKELFQLNSSLIQLMNKKNGVWTVVDLRRFGIPMRQASLFGIKKGRYLCSVSINGLTHHSTLFQVLSLGLLETLEIAPSK